MATSKRNVRIHFRLTEEEADLLKEKMERSHSTHLGTFMRAMIFKGYIINLDLSEVREVLRLLRISSNNINQISKHANETGAVYKKDIDDMKENYDQLWDSMKEILQKLNELMNI